LAWWPSLWTGTFAALLAFSLASVLLSSRGCYTVWWSLRQTAQPWKRYGRSSRFSVGSKLPGTGFSRPSPLVFFPGPETLPEKHPPFCVALRSNGGYCRGRRDCIKQPVRSYCCWRLFLCPRFTRFGRPRPALPDPPSCRRYLPQRGNDNLKFLNSGKMAPRVSCGWI